MALRGVPLSQFSIDEKMKWSEYGETQVLEDRAYCLIGIFVVQMTPFYGEGVNGAFTWLMHEAYTLNRCLQELRLTDPHNDKKRIEDPKGGLLKDSYCWILQNNSFRQWHEDPQSRLLWIKGDPGKGKTMLLCGIIDELQKFMAKMNLVSCFFCPCIRQIGCCTRENIQIKLSRGTSSALLEDQPNSGQGSHSSNGRRLALHLITPVLFSLYRAVAKARSLHLCPALNLSNSRNLSKLPSKAQWANARTSALPRHGCRDYPRSKNCRTPCQTA